MYLHFFTHGISIVIVYNTLEVTSYICSVSIFRVYIRTHENVISADCSHCIISSRKFCTFRGFKAIFYKKFTEYPEVDLFIFYIGFNDLLFCHKSRNGSFPFFRLSFNKYLSKIFFRNSIFLIDRIISIRFYFLDIVSFLFEVHFLLCWVLFEDIRVWKFFDSPPFKINVLSFLLVLRKFRYLSYIDTCSTRNTRLWRFYGFLYRCFSISCGRDDRSLRIYHIFCRSRSLYGWIFHLFWREDIYHNQKEKKTKKSIYNSFDPFPKSVSESFCIHSREF